MEYNVTLRNALCRELETMTGREDWYAVFHNESICWNLDRVEEIHQEMTTVLGWINKDVPGWLSQIDRFNTVCDKIRMAMSWKK